MAMLRDLSLLIKMKLSLLVLSSALIGFWLASSHPMNLGLFSVFGLGTFLVVAGANAFNEVIERDFDRLMVRTASRPLPAGRMSVRHGVAIALLMTICGLFLLAYNVSLEVAILAFIASALYLFFYTPMKRISPLCVLIGAVPGAIPAMMGPAAALHAITPLSWLMFGIVFFWQFPHFCAIAWLAKDDYKQAGFKMLAEPADTRFTAYQILLFSGALMMISPLLTVMRHTGVYYFVGSLFLGIILMAYAFFFWFSLSKTRARQLMSVAMLYLPFLFVLMILDKVNLWSR